MVQWKNLNWNNSFINPLPLLYEISGAVQLALVGLIARWLDGRQAGWLADEIHLIFLNSLQIEIL